MIQIAKCDGIT